jgi:hypothetical protein
MNTNTKYPHGQNQIPFEDVPVGAPFIDAEFGGVWLKCGERIDTVSAICIEDDSAYRIMDGCFFSPDATVYLCTRGKDGWVELFPAKELSRNETSLLLYFETQMVDNGGLLQSCRMNKDDFAIAKRWNDEKFIQFGRILWADIKPSDQPRDHWVVLSEAASAACNHERRARADRKMSTITVARIGIDSD